MVASFHKPGRCARRRLLACVVVTFAAATAAAPITDTSLPIDLTAASSDFDYKNNTVVFRKVKITQGEMQVEADQASATGLNFDNAEWRLDGQVRIRVPDGRLSADNARVSFRENVITRAVVRGSPAKFEQRLQDSKQLAQGQAGSIEYDVSKNTVRLQGDAWLTDGQNEIRGNTLIYNIAAQRVVANPDERDPDGVRITINPNELRKPGEKDRSP
jgi:lipopolysaccharide transport protein LptA